MLRILKTHAGRVVLPILLFLIWAPAASAWSWPVAGPVLEPFAYDEAHPYAAGQHRGVDIGADAMGETVVAPAAGTVSFAGTVPTNGTSVTIETADGYAVTLTHLGSLAVVKGAVIGEGDTVGAVGPSGTPELDGPYVHLGIRVAADPNGYVDPLGLLPPASATGASDGGSGSSQPSSGGATSTVPTSEPAPPAAAGPSVATTRGSTVSHNRDAGSSRDQAPARESRADARARASSNRPAGAEAHAPQRSTSRTRVDRPTSSSRRPVVEPAAPREPTRLGAGHEISPGEPADRLAQPSSALVPLLCNGVAALVALCAALAAGRRPRHRVDTSSSTTAQILHLPQTRTEHRRAA